MHVSAEEIAGRRPLWWALSDLMLDTDLPEVWGPNIARAMREAHCTLTEAHFVFLHEVGPAFIFNFVAIAGEWAGWDEAFVADRVLMRLRRPRWLQWFSARLLRGQLQAVWEHTLPAVQRALNENAAEAPAGEVSSR